MVKKHCDGIHCRRSGQRIIDDIVGHVTHSYEYNIVSLIAVRAVQIFSYEAIDERERRDFRDPSRILSKTVYG